MCVYQLDAAGVPQILVKRFLTFVSRTISVFPPHLGPSICCNLVTSIRLRGQDSWWWDLPSFDIGSATLNHLYVFIVFVKWM